MLSDKELLVYNKIKDHFKESREPLYLISFNVDSIDESELEIILDKLALQNKIVINKFAIQPYIETVY